MKLPKDEQPSDGHFRNHDLLSKIERQLFAHVRELGDLRQLSGLEQILYCVLSDELDEDLAMDLCPLLVTQAVERVLRDPSRYMTTVPYGISRAERFAAFFEEDCPLCEAKIGLEDPDEEEDEHEDDCACCAMLVREWRAQHADALRRYGGRVSAQVRV